MHLHVKIREDLGISNSLTGMGFQVGSKYVFVKKGKAYGVQSRVYKEGKDPTYILEMPNGDEVEVPMDLFEVVR